MNPDLEEVLELQARAVKLQLEAAYAQVEHWRQLYLSELERNRKE